MLYSMGVRDTPSPSTVTDLAASSRAMPPLRRTREVSSFRWPPQRGVAAELAFYPGQDLNGVERLGHIVVRPDIEAQDLVRVLALGCEEDDRDILALPELGGGADPVHVGHHHVHEDEMDLPLLHDLQRFQSVVSVIGLVPVAGEVDVQGGYDIRSSSQMRMLYNKITPPVCYPTSRFLSRKVEKV